MNVSSSSSSTNSVLDALLAAQARQASAATSKASYATATAAVEADSASPIDASTGSSSPAAPSSFDIQRSTSDFAGSRGGVGGHHGGGHHGNPAALLDTGTTEGTDSDSTTPDAMQARIAQGYLDLMGSDFGATGALSLSA